LRDYFGARHSGRALPHYSAVLTFDAHSGLLALSPEEIEHELVQSYNHLVAHLAVKSPPTSLSERPILNIASRLCAKIGYSCAFTTERRDNEADHDLFTLGRVLIDDDDEASPAFDGGWQSCGTAYRT
jgi:hypothetical protein